MEMLLVLTGPHSFICKSKHIESVVKVRIMEITEVLRYSDESAINHPPSLSLSLKFVHKSNISIITLQKILVRGLNYDLVSKISKK